MVRMAVARAARRIAFACVALLALSNAASTSAQSSATPPAAQKPASPGDSLDRGTPRGTVLGFMKAVREDRTDIAVQYLNTPLRGAAAVTLAEQLFVVLDRRLPPRLSVLSDRPEGSLTNPFAPDRDVIGTLTTSNGPLDLVVERTNRGAAGSVWVFSRATLAAIPDVYDEVNLVAVDRFLPEIVLKPRLLGIRLFEWVAFVLLFGLVYVLPGFRRLIPGSVRLFVLAIVTRWLVAAIDLPLVERRFWTSIAAVLAIAAATSIALGLNQVAVRYALRRSESSGRGEIATMLRPARRVVDGLILAIAVIVALYYFGVDPTAALAGLGIGGIAVALAAQKTLENVIGGVSIIADKAVCVGDAVKVGDVAGTVDYIGLRSTRIRTVDRTIVTVPNGQIATVNVETLSARDKFWFRHFLSLRQATKSSQMRQVIEEIQGYLQRHPSVDVNESVRARFVRLGTSSLDIEVFAYLRQSGWDEFLATQQEMLLEIMAIVERAGTSIALPSQLLHLVDTDTAAAGLSWLNRNPADRRASAPR
jgi:MscS family membrane protein